MDPSKEPIVDVFSTLSHELRSPVMAIKGYASTLLSHATELSHEEQHDFLHTIYNAGCRLETVINRLLEVIQLEEDPELVDMSVIDPVLLVQEAIKTVQYKWLKLQSQAATSDRQELSSIEPLATTLLINGENYTDNSNERRGCIWPIWGDPRKLKEAIDALLENAMLYSTCRPVVIEIGVKITHAEQSNRYSIEAELASRQDAMVEICVRDHGKGIPEQQLIGIFERFQRVDMRLSRDVGGLGLGLTICKKIIELHHGKIWAESEVDKGSTFHVLLPLEI